MGNKKLLVILFPLVLLLLFIYGSNAACNDYEETANNEWESEEGE